MSDIYNKLLNTFEDFSHDMNVNIYNDKLVIKSNLEVKRNGKLCKMSEISCLNSSNMPSNSINQNIQKYKLGHINSMLDSLLSDKEENKESTNKKKKEKNVNKVDANNNVRAMTEEEYIEEDPSITAEDLETWNSKTLLFYQDEINELKKIKHDYNIDDKEVVKHANELDSSIKNRKDIKPKNIESVIKYLKENLSVERAG